MSFSDQPKSGWQKLAYALFCALAILGAFALLWLGAYPPAILWVFILFTLLLAGFGLSKLFLRD